MECLEVRFNMTGEQGIFCANHHSPKFVSSRARDPGPRRGRGAAPSSSEQLGAVLAAHDAEDSLFRALARQLILHVFTRIYLTHIIGIGVQYVLVRAHRQSFPISRRNLDHFTP